MKKSLKILSIMLAIVMLSAVMLMPSYAIDSPDEMTHDTTAAGTQKIVDLGNKIYGIIFTIGIVLSVIVIAVLGIKYMMGSTEEKAEYKKTMMPYLVGAVLVFAASTIATVVFNFITK